MQMEKADLAPGAATWRTRRNVLVVFDSDQFLALTHMKTCRPQNRKYVTYRIANSRSVGYKNVAEVVGATSSEDFQFDCPRSVAGASYCTCARRRFVEVSARGCDRVAGDSSQ